MKETKFARSPYIVLTWSDAGALVLTDCATLRQYEASELIVRILGLLSQPKTSDTLADALGVVPRAVVAHILDFLRQTELVLDASASTPTLERWSLFELAVQRQLALGGVRVVPAGSRPSAAKHICSKELVGLPRAPADGGATLRSTLHLRQSRRRYSDRPLSLGQLGEFLDLTASSRERDRRGGEPESRSYPSGGACYPLELYVLAERVTGLRRAVYHYDPRAHELAFVKSPDQRYDELLEIVAANTGGLLNRSPCIVVHITAVFARTMWRYAYLGLATIYRDVGCLFQNMYLVATEMGLAPCAIGGVQDIDNARWLDLDPLEEAQVGSFLVGMPE